MDVGDIVELNVGGVPYTTTKQTLCGAVEPHSMLARIVQCGIPSRRDATGRIFIDRDGVRFRSVLNYLRSATIHCTHDRTALRELAEEAEYFGMDGLVKKTSDELVRIELEEELGSMTSAVRDEQRGFDVMLHTSPIMSQESMTPENNRNLRDDSVVRSLDFSASFTDMAPVSSHGTPPASVPSALQSSSTGHIFTLDADF